MAYKHWMELILMNGGHFMKQVKDEVPERLRKGIPSAIRKGHTVWKDFVYGGERIPSLFPAPSSTG